MTFNQLNNNPEGWKRLPDRDMNSQPFYTIQKGKGAAMQYIPPMEGIIEKAKVKLRKQLKKTTPKKRSQSKVGKRRGKTAPKTSRKKVTKRQTKKPANKAKGNKKRVNKSKK